MAKLDVSQTPNRLWAAFVVIVLATVILWAFSLGGVDYARSRVQTITKDSVPSVIAAQDIRKGLFKMDGDTVANYLRLTHNDAAIFDINQDRLTLAKQLVVAAQNITYGEAESVPIRDLVGRLPMYSELTSPALEGQGNWRAKRLLMASKMLHEELERAANDLDKVNRDHLTDAFNDSQRGLKLREAIAWTLGIGVLLVLGFCQLGIARLFHRAINVPLAVATLLTIVVVVSNAHLMAEETNSLKAAKLDAFDSVGYLSEAEAAVEDTRAEALYSLIPEGKSQASQDCEKELANLAQTSNDADQEQTYTAQAPPSFKGLLGNELRNITFQGEIEAANAELHAFEKMKQTVLALRDAPNGDAAFSQAFSPSSSVDQVSEEVDKDIEVTRQINMKEFERERDQSFALLTFPALSLNLLSLLILALAYVGIRQRLTEYSD